MSETNKSKERVRVEVDAVIWQMQEIAGKAARDRDQLAIAHPDWKMTGDARLTGFTMLTSVLGSAIYGLTFSNRGLLNDEWWKENVEDSDKMSEKDKGIAWYNFMQFTKVGFVQFIFAGIESTFRIFLRSIDPIACSGGTAEFKSIYDSLLSTKLSKEPADAIVLLDLFRLVRNTVHNNGVYFHKSRKDEQVIYKDVTYNFRFGKPIDFVEWNLILMLVDDVRQLLVQVVSDPAISEQTLIENPNIYP